MLAITFLVFMMKKIIIPVTVILFLFLFGCAKAPVEEGATEENPGETVAPKGNNIPTQEERCGLENCHGLSFSCGRDVPDACTMNYQIGDFCRQYAICETINNECQMVPNKTLDKCVNCVKPCEELEGEAAFKCESDCRQEIK